MKKFFVFVIGLTCASLNLMAARTSSKKRISLNTTSSVKLKDPSETECRENIDYCFNRYCFDKKTLEKGVYSKCGSVSASTIQLNVEDCLDTRAVIKELNLNTGCKAYTYNYIVSLLAGKDKIETALKKSTKECQSASLALESAKKCWAEMIASDGSIDASLRSKLTTLCGYNQSRDANMVDRFYKAGDYGDSNIGAQMDMLLTGQNTKKRENWRQVVDGVLAGYMEMAELACGEEDYSLTKVNDYDLDNRENLAYVRARAQAEELGRATANKIVNYWFRSVDCLNSPLPVGGERWQFVEGGAPECRLVCKYGYEQGNTSSECVKTKLSNFVGLNLGLGTGDMTAVGKSNVAVNDNDDNVSLTDLKMPSSSSHYSSPSVGVSGASNCSSALPSQNFSLTKGGICKVFFPNCASGNLGTRNWYERFTSGGNEFFCIGESSGRFDYKISLTLGRINSVFGQSFTQFGSQYANGASLYLYNNCASFCGANGGNGSSGGDCADVPDLNIKYETRKKWDTFLETHTLPNCTNNEKQRLISLFKAYDECKKIGNGRVCPSESDIVGVMSQIKKCACASGGASSGRKSSSGVSTTGKSSVATISVTKECPSIPNIKYVDNVAIELDVAEKFITIISNMSSNPNNCDTSSLPEWKKYVGWASNDGTELADPISTITELKRSAIKFRKCMCGLK